MNPDRKTLADLFARLHGMGVESAAADLACIQCKTTGDWWGVPCPYCGGFGFHKPIPAEVLPVLGEMMNVATPGITMSDVLDAAKKAGVYP